MNPKLLHISTARSWRGGEQQIAYLVKELREENWQQYIACIRDSPLHQWAIKENIPVLALKKRSSLDLSFAKKLKQYSKQEDISIWHAHDAHAHGFAVYAKALFGSKERLVVSRRVDFPVAKSMLSRFKYNFEGVAKYLAVSDAIAKILKKSIKEPNKVFTVHSSIDPSKFERAEKGILRSEYPEFSAKFWIGNVAALAGHKDHKTFLSVAAELLKHDKDLHFFIAGEGELESELKAMAIDLKISEHVSFLGFREDVPSLLLDFNCFLFTSEMEGLGTSILDAFAAKIPVVATQAGGIPEMVIPGETGLLAPVKDFKTLAQFVAQIKADSSLAEKLVAQAQIKLQEFLPQAMAKKTAWHYLN